MSTGMPAGIWLNKFGGIVEDAFGEHPYQVGSSLTTKDWRDVDVRLILDDDVFAEMFGQPESYINAKVAAMELAFSALGSQMTGLPIDFQIQTMSHGSTQFGGQPRNPLMEIEPITNTFPDSKTQTENEHAG